MLDVSGNNLYVKAAHDIAMILSNNSCLENLYLSSNNLQIGAIKITQAIKNTLLLKDFNISDNN